ncbi:hypothetical protein Niako_6610 [Niastella koreensis GR20-10]|uniref:Uncharacterized protein n=1 Tax=Niastella koreensis (strain DSM 17620 / KACC 11465 / NBRC 106392 / GR20-10) TaxID=700598 RepID=G8THI8_NIAKG|nr:hypothetical protein Niako_6610 [Niastella koreensis GR20-10]
MNYKESSDYNALANMLLSEPGCMGFVGWWGDRPVASLNAQISPQMTFWKTDTNQKLMRFL